MRQIIPIRTTLTHYYTHPQTRPPQSQTPAYTTPQIYICTDHKRTHAPHPRTHAPHPRTGGNHADEAHWVDVRARVVQQAQDEVGAAERALDQIVPQLVVVDLLAEVDRLRHLPYTRTPSAHVSRPLLSLFDPRNYLNSCVSKGGRGARNYPHVWGRWGCPATQHTRNYPHVIPRRRVQECHCVYTCTRLNTDSTSIHRPNSVMISSSAFLMLPTRCSKKTISGMSRRSSQICMASFSGT